MRKILLIGLLLLPGFAQAAPSDEDKLFDALAKASSSEEAQPIEQRLTALFKVSNSATVDLLMTRAAAALAAADNQTARKLIDSVTDIAPSYAEGWRQRAHLQAAAGDDAGAMLSLQKAVADNPRHFMAMSELGDMLENYGDKAGALKLYRRVLALDPQMEGAARHVRALEKEVEGEGI